MYEITGTFHGPLSSRHDTWLTARAGGPRSTTKGVAMRQSLRAVINAAGIGALAAGLSLGLGGCNRNGDRAFGWDAGRAPVGEGRPINETGDTGRPPPP